MTRVVIESPLAGDLPANQRYARRAVRDSLARSEAPYAAHLFYAHPELLDDLIPEQRALGLTAGLLWASQAEICAVYLDRGLSRGMELGIAQARQLGMRISLRWLDQINRSVAATAAIHAGYACRLAAPRAGTTDVTLIAGGEDLPTRPVTDHSYFASRRGIPQP